MRVDFPAPFSPHNPWISPRRTWKDTLSRAVTPGNFFVTFLNSRMMSSLILESGSCYRVKLGFLVQTIFYHNKEAQLPQTPTGSALLKAFRALVDDRHPGCRGRHRRMTGSHS